MWRGRRSGNSSTGKRFTMPRRCSNALFGWRLLQCPFPEDLARSSLSSLTSSDCVVDAGGKAAHPWGPVYIGHIIHPRGRLCIIEVFCTPGGWIWRLSLSARSSSIARRFLIEETFDPAFQVWPRRPRIVAGVMCFPYDAKAVYDFFSPLSLVF